MSNMKKMNNTPRGSCLPLCGSIWRRTAAALCAVMLLTVLASARSTVYAQTPEEVQPDHPEVSTSDSVSGSDVFGAPAEFTRVISVPANVPVPDFYQQVINVSGLYIFTMPDGVIHKRLYGAIDDVYGWYVPVGPDNIVYQDARPIDTAEDARMYYEALSQAELDAMGRQDYSGILPPEEGVTAVDEVQGVSVTDLTFYFVGGAVGLCLLITIGALIARRSDNDDEPPQQWGQWQG